MSNSFYNQLELGEQAPFQEMEPIEAHNIGRRRAWRLSDLFERAAEGGPAP